MNFFNGIIKGSSALANRGTKMTKNAGKQIDSRLGKNMNGIKKINVKEDR